MASRYPSAQQNRHSWRYLDHLYCCTRPERKLKATMVGLLDKIEGDVMNDIIKFSRSETKPNPTHKF